MESLYGTGVAIATPFTEQSGLDLDSLRRLVNHCIDGGVDYLVVLGTTGESVTLDDEEKGQVISTVVQENKGRLPLVLGIGGNHTAKLVKELKTAPLKDFEAVLSVSPYYNKPTQEGIYRHYKVLSEVSPKPLILYNVPGRTASNVLPDTVRRLAEDCPNIAAIKEASGNNDQVQELLEILPDDFMVISGDDFTALDTVLAGGAGVISVLAQAVPNEFTAMIRAGRQGKPQLARTWHDSLLKGMDLIFDEGNPAGIKAMLEYQSICRAVVRLPLVEASEDLKKRIGQFVDGLVQTPA